MTKDFAHLHTHSHASAFDGFGNESRFAGRIAEMGYSALAFTEHGSLRGLMSAQKACDEAKIQFIPGIEAYLCDDIGLRGVTEEERKAVRSRTPDKEVAKALIKAMESDRRDRDHITIWAMNDVGRQNLYRLSSISWNAGFYYKPRLDMTTIIEHNEGLIVSTGCPGGVVTSPLRRGDWGAALQRFERLHRAFGDRLYIEVMPHVMEDCTDLQSMLADLSRSYNVQMIATQDAHYPTKADAAAQEVLLCIHIGECIDDPDRFAAKAFGKHDFYLRTREEMIAALTANTALSRRDIINACNATVDLASRCTTHIDTTTPGKYLASPDLPSAYVDYDDWLLALCEQGWEERYGVAAHEDTSRPHHLARLAKECRVLKDYGFARYMVTVQDIIAFCRSVDIRVGPGRGSAAGSLVSYLLGITSLDPVVHGLSFERFIAPGRKDLPDIDIDIQHDRRDEVITYLMDRYGDDRVIHIATNVSMRGKGVLRDVGRVFNIPIVETEKLTSVIAESLTEEEQGDDTVAVAIRETEVGKRFNESYPDVSAAAIALEGQHRTSGIHPAGIVVAPVPIVDLVPIESRANPGDGPRIPVIAFDMKAVEKMGLVKIDLLGLKAMTVEALAMREIGIPHDHLDELPLDDAETLDAFSAGRFGGIFQYDSASARRLCRDFTFKRFADIAVMTSLNRPGPMKSGLAQAYLDRAKDPSIVPKLHPVYDAITAETYGVIIYQEQVVALARELASYSDGEADAFRKKVAKKTGLGDEETKFVAGAIANGMVADDAERLFRSIVGFGAYAFNASHAYAYAAVGYQLMWLRVHHPAAFYMATLAIRDKAEDLMRIAAEARREGIPVLAPDVNVSRGKFTLHHDKDDAPLIVGSTADIKGIGSTTASAIAAVMPFTSLKDFYDRTRQLSQGRVTLSTFKALAQTTSLRSICPNTKLLVENAPAIWEALSRGHAVELDSSSVEDYSEDVLIKLAAERYRLYVNANGRGDFAAVHDAIKPLSKRPVLTVEEVPQVGPDYAFVIGRINESKLYAEAEGGRSARVTLLSEIGSELVCRVSSDALSDCGTAVEQKGEIALSLVYVRTHPKGTSYDVEGLWLASDLEKAGTAGILAVVAAAAPTRPRNPAAIFNNTQIGKQHKASGVVTRVRRHRDKNNNMMMTVGLLGERSFIRFFVFSSRMRGEDVQLVKVGTNIAVTLEKLSNDASCLSQQPIQTA